MSWIFGDSFDLYAAAGDLIAGYWDGSNASVTLPAGRFAGSQAIQLSNSNVLLTKASGQNDPVHHIVYAFEQTAALGGTTKGAYFNLTDGGTTQCSIVHRSDGAILLTTAANGGGAVLATYTGAFTAAATWNSYEIEVVINNTAGSFKVRANGSPTDSFSATGLNTRNGTTNNYANSLSVGLATALSYHLLDDFLWRSDAASGSGLATWVGDIRCYARMPNSDAQVQFTGQNPGLGNLNLGYGYGQTSQTFAANNATFMSFVPPYGGMLTGATITVNSSPTASITLAIYDTTGPGGTPGNLLAASTPVVNPATGPVTFTFPTPLRLQGGTTYVLACNQSASVQYAAANNYTQGYSAAYNVSLPYASWPPSTVSVAWNAGVNIYTVTANPLLITLGNFGLVQEVHEDAATSYVYDSTVGHADFYTIGAIPVAPVSTIAVTTRGFAEKSDAGARSGAMQLKSGSSTVASPSTLLLTSWSWLWRTDVNDPATGSAWTATGVNNVQVGPTVTA